MMTSWHWSALAYLPKDQMAAISIQMYFGERKILYFD